MYRSALAFVNPGVCSVVAGMLLCFASSGAVADVHETKHLSIQQSMSVEHVKPGGRVTLALTVVLKPGMHVYAPGVQSDYIPIQWTMLQSAAAQIEDASYPGPQKLYLKAIDETVPAYTGEFRIAREVRVNDKSSVGKLTLEGKFRYQACDDRLCYIPQTVPLTWTLHVD